MQNHYHRANRAAKEVIESCKGLEGQAIAERADVSSMADARRLVEVAVNRFGKLDIFVANAGILLCPYSSWPRPWQRSSPGKS